MWAGGQPVNDPQLCFMCVCVGGVSLCLHVQLQMFTRHRTNRNAHLSTQQAEHAVPAPGSGDVQWVGRLLVQVRDLPVSCLE